MKIITAVQKKNVYTKPINNKKEEKLIILN